MNKQKSFILAILMTCLGTVLTSCSNKGDQATTSARQFKTLSCIAPQFLEPGDKVALISPSYYTPMENVEKTAEVLRGWGLEPVVGPNVGRIDAGKYAGTVEERLSDIRWALNDKSIKAIICNRGGYGTIQLVDRLQLNERQAHPKWIVGFSDITTLHEMEQCAGVMSIHGTMSSFLAAGGKDAQSTLMRDLLMGKVPRYEMPAHPQNRLGHAEGVLVGGNLLTFAPVVGSQADVTSYDNIILFIEEVEESLHSIDRQINMLQLQGVLSRCKGVILGEFTDCSSDLDYESAEALISTYLSRYNIPVLCGFPAGHGDVNLPLVMGANVTMEVREDGSTLSFRMDGEQKDVHVDRIMEENSLETPSAKMMEMAARVE